MKHNTMTRIVASLFCCLMIPTMTAFAEEEAAKNFQYYYTLSDYEVYLEYCELYGFEAETTLPEETELPDYQFLRYYTKDGGHGIKFYVYCDKAVPSALEDTPEIFGLPAEWYEHTLIESTEDSALYSYHCVARAMETAGIATTESGTECTMYSVEYNFKDVSYFETEYAEDSYEDSIVDIYRVRLSLHHSDFVAQYACLEDDPNVSPVVQLYTIETNTAPSAVYGDINGDGAVNATDAACILQYAAAVGAGYSGTLETYMAEQR